MAAKQDVARAAQAAIRDWLAGTGGYYSGPATGVYLRIRAVLREEGEHRPNPHVVVFNPPRGRDPHIGRGHVSHAGAGRLPLPFRVRGTDCIVGQIAENLHALQYEHAEDGEFYEHRFEPGAQMFARSDGTIVLMRRDDQPLWEDI